MANIREIKNRVKSTKNTAKVTRAMQMVSAAKSKAASKEAISIAEFSQKLNEIVNKLGIDTRPLTYTDKKIAVVVIGPSRGFVGQLTNSLITKLISFISEHPNIQIDGIAVQKNGAKIVTQSGLKVKYNFESSEDIQPILSLLQDYAEVYLAYAHFINLLNSEVRIIKLSPVESDQTKTSGDDSFLYEPNRQEVRNSLIEKMLEAKILSAILNSHASEHAARMITMKNATENAVELVGTLTQSLNKERQNKITQQIIEVASGGKKYEN